MKKSVFKNRMNQLFNNAQAQAIAGAGGGNNEVRSTPLAVGDKLTMRISDTTTIEEIVTANSFTGNDKVTREFNMVHFEEHDLALSKLCRRANGLRLKGATLWEMLQDFVGRVVANGGSYTIQVDEIREVVFDNGNTGKYYVFSVVTQNIPALEDDEPSTDNTTDEPSTDNTTDEPSTDNA